MHSSGINEDVVLSIVFDFPSQVWDTALAFSQLSPFCHSTLTEDALWSRLLLLQENVSLCLLLHQVSGQLQSTCSHELALLATLTLANHQLIDWQLRLRAEGKVNCLLFSSTVSGSVFPNPNFRNSNIFILVQVYINRNIQWHIFSGKAWNSHSKIDDWMISDCSYYSISLLGQKSHIQCGFKLC